MTRILIIEDDKAIRLSLEEDLSMEGYEVETASEGVRGMELALQQSHDLILLDLMLPGVGGLEICKELRKKEISTPIIMLTAKSQDLDKIIGLELGADDYMTKPFNSQELRSRVKAVLRRSKPVAERPGQVIRHDVFEIDTVKYEFRLRGEKIPLTQLEFDVLALLMKHPGEVLTRDEILDQVWGKEVFVTPRTVDAHISKMRQKFSQPEDQDRIVPFRGVGYKFLAFNKT